jgi:16S rRNA (adenine1518-N6/adenine1519-N6)-dimethyltransferase
MPYAKKSLGQHWLTDKASLEAMCQAAEVGPYDTVLEIGPGIGTLTEVLVRRAGEVIAVEFDQRLVEALPERVVADNLRVVHQDILRFDLTSLPPDYKVVANIPYYLTSNLLRTLCESANPPQTIALLVQKEVAERVVAGPGNMSLLSVSVQFYCEASLGPIVPANLFTPPPKVDSQILRLRYRQRPLFEVDTKAFFRVVRAGFSARRKTVLNSLSGGLRLSKEVVRTVLERAGIDANTRPQALSLNDWHKLYNALQTNED